MSPEQRFTRKVKHSIDKMQLSMAVDTNFNNNMK